MYPKLISLIGIIVLWSCLSCATLFNTPTQELTIYPSSDATIICQEDTIVAHDKAVKINVNRSKNDLLITTISDSVKKSVVIPSAPFVWLLWKLRDGYLRHYYNASRNSKPQNMGVSKHHFY